MTNKLIYIVVALALLGCAAFITANGQRNPMDSQRVWLAKAIDEIDESPVSMTDSQYDYQGWQSAIKGNDYLWKALVAPPPPDPRLKALRDAELKAQQAANAQAKIPDIEKKLGGVSITRARVGSKARIILPEYPRGVFLGPGDVAINDCVVLEVTPTSVKFGFFWDAEDRYIEHSMSSDD